GVTNQSPARSRALAIEVGEFAAAYNLTRTPPFAGAVPHAPSACNLLDISSFDVRFQLRVARYWPPNIDAGLPVMGRKLENAGARRTMTAEMVEWHVVPVGVEREGDRLLVDLVGCGDGASDA